MRQRSLLLLAAAGALGGCLGYEDDQVQWREDFEVCGACDWSIAGEVAIVTTNHPGEHAAQLDGGAVMRRALMIARQVDDDPGRGWDYDRSFTDGNWIEYSSDCPGRPELELRDAGDDALDVALTLAGPAVAALTRRHLTFPALPASVPPDDPDDPDLPARTITFRELRIGSAGRCRVDAIRVMVSGGTYGY